jgi:hypothetical protein
MTEEEKARALARHLFAVEHRFDTAIAELEAVDPNNPRLDELRLKQRWYKTKVLGRTLHD